MNRLSKWLEKREINKLREEFKYALYRYAEKHRNDKDESKWFLILALLPMFGVMLFIEQIPEEYSFLIMAGVMAWVIFILFVPEFYDEYIKSANTLTVESAITPLDKEHRDDMYCLLRNVEFGSQIEITEDIISEVKKITAQDMVVESELPLFQRAVKRITGGDTKNKVLYDNAEHVSEGISKALEEEDEDRRWIICTMMAEGDTVPAITLWEGIPKSECDFKKKSVYLPSGFANIQSARVSFVECDPIRTSIVFKGIIIDVEFPLFKVYETQKSKLRRIESSEIRLPTTSAEIAATITKKIVDSDAAEKTYMNVVDERNKNAEGMRRALENEREERSTNPPDMKKATTREEQIKLVLTYVFMIALGYLLHSAIMG